MERKAQNIFLQRLGRNQETGEAYNMLGNAGQGTNTFLKYLTALKSGYAGVGAHEIRSVIDRLFPAIKAERDAVDRRAGNIREQWRNVRYHNDNLPSVGGAGRNV